ncbi:DUF2029 domain-containing protein [Corynebacterium sp. TAE3-ERU12]|uniref:glycosyltransferase family 87 protein n=1 Tax=Corynebacterium sp. TAE3-ERU12 TaxID=2849491 RepID=UPI001C479B8F|nr:glycosyltransferase family 87 protein [Corynebacterium sp. TAE3-ERU12]MBV7295337.1 DUF2029 domain-containing protein [Corynebacterium sp. TAE3-ERU12]
MRKEAATADLVGPTHVDTPGNTALHAVFWPLAAIALFHRVYIRGTSTLTDDYTTVFTAIRRFIEGGNVYQQDYASVVPHYLYSPGATLLLAPFLGWTSDVETSRAVFLTIQVLAIMAAILVMFRWMGISGRSWVYPATIFGALLTETVSNTIAFTNVNGVLLLLVTLFLITLLDGRVILAGLIIGLAITVKPVVAPLLFLPFALRRFSTVGVGIAVPVVANAVAWPLMPHPEEYLTLTLPYLAEVRSYANVSIAGQFVFFGASPKWLMLWQVLLAGAVIVGLILLLRWIDRDRVFWATTTSALLLTGAFLLGSLGQMYYTMLLFPLVATIARPIRGVTDAHGKPVRTVAAAWPFWVGFALCVWFDSFLTEGHPLGSYWFDIGRGTLGWIIILLSITGCVVKWTIEDVAAGENLMPGFSFRTRDKNGTPHA